MQLYFRQMARCNLEHVSTSFPLFKIEVSHRDDLHTLHVPIRLAHTGTVHSSVPVFRPILSHCAESNSGFCPLHPSKAFLHQKRRLYPFEPSLARQSGKLLAQSRFGCCRKDRHAPDRPPLVSLDRNDLPLGRFQRSFRPAFQT